MIYYVEDDRNIRDLVVYSLEQSGYEALGFPDGAGFFRELERRQPELILLDIMLPGESGLDILRRLRDDRRTAALPVIMVTAMGEETDKVQGLEHGADDYISKPFGIMELLSRVKALLRRAYPADAGQTDDVIQAGELALHTASYTAECNGRTVGLALKEFELLCFLARNPGKAFRREELLEQVWGCDYTGGTRTVDVHIQTLRGKLGDCAAMIKTIRGLGYRFGDGEDV